VMDDSSSKTYDVAVIGGGVVGITVARSAILAGLKVVLLEACPDLLTGASGSNSGIACTGVDASEGTLERALIRDSISQIRGFCRRHNVPNRQCGSLVCLWPWDQDQVPGHPNTESSAKLRAVAEESWDAGDTHAVILDSNEVASLEPNLSKQCMGAVHIPGEIIVDPWLFPMAMVTQARENGLVVYTNYPCSAKDSMFNEATKTWTLQRDSEAVSCETTTRSTSDSPIPDIIRARAVINATGINSDITQKNAADVPPPTWTCKPRRGQYRIFASNDKTRFDRPIQPVPTQITKGIFVFSTLYNQIAVGPTALDQESRSDTKPDDAVAEALSILGKKILPDLDVVSDFVDEYVGIRPGTDKRDYQIHAYPDKCWISAAGIRSTGLTASLGIGRYVVKSLLPILLDVQSEAGTYFDDAPLPAAVDLIHEFNERGDGCIALYGREYRVTHPLTALGWKAQA